MSHRIPTLESFMAGRANEAHGDDLIDQIVAEIGKAAGGAKAGWDSSLEKVARDTVSSNWTKLRKKGAVSDKDAVVKTIADAVSLPVAKLVTILNNALAHLD